MHTCQEGSLRVRQSDSPLISLCIPEDDTLFKAVGPRESVHDSVAKRRPFVVRPHVREVDVAVHGKL